MITVDLSGKWDVCLDKTKRGLLPAEYPYTIQLPDTTSNAQLGEQCRDIEYGCLTDTYKFEGYAWFKRSIEVTPDMEGKCLTLFIERTRKTMVFMDGRERGCCDSLCAPHRYSFGGLSVGSHELIIRVDNTEYPTGGGHMTSRDTQTNWNGITGRIELQSYDAYPEAVTILPDVANHSVTIKADIVGTAQGEAHIRVFDDADTYGEISAAFESGNTLECTIPLKESVPLWSEFSPALLYMEIDLGSDVRTLSFGMRQMSSDKRKLLVNGRQTFLRGKHDGMVFPKTGYAPADTKAWTEVFRIAKSYGINHYRFHTCCPPEAAFNAADIMGIYMQPELPFWGTIPDEFGDEHNYLREEGYRILREYGHHPSFVMMSMGNELWGSKERLNELMAGYKSVAPDKLYVCGSNNYQFMPCVLEEDDFFSGVRLDRDRLIRGSYAMCDAPQGHIQTTEPNSVHSYDDLIDTALGSNENADDQGEIMIQYGTGMKKVKAQSSDTLIPEVPVISHEVGQFAMYPDFSETAKYTGSIKHYAYESYRKGLEEKGLFRYHEDFFKASGALAVQCYRDDIETALRSSQMSGFQLLDLQDFPGQGVATVGILNAFLENKGHISAEKWCNFCNSTVVLAQLEGFVFTSDEKIDAGILLSNTDPDFVGSSLSWSVGSGDRICASGRLDIPHTEERLCSFGNIEFAISCEHPAKAVLRIIIDGTDIENSYDLYIFPQSDVKITENSIICGERKLPIVHSIEEAKALDGKALCIPLLDETALVGEYCTDFWCYGMFRSISESMNKPVPTGTLGLLINTDDELLNGFISESYTTPQWYDIVNHSRCADISTTDIEPVVWVIDNPERQHRLALLYRDNGVVCCTSRLWEVSDKIAVKHFAASILDYILR